MAEAAALTEVILDVATAHFLEAGYQETTFERIAHEAGTSKGAIYSRYPEKVSLFSAVCESLIVKLYKSDIVKLDTKMPIRACLTKQGCALLAAALNPTALKLYQMITHDVPRHPELSRSTLAVWDFYVSQMQGYLQNRIDRGFLSLRRPHEVAERFVQMLFGPVHVVLIHGREMLDDEQLRRHVEETVLVFLGGIGRLELESMDSA